MSVSASQFLKWCMVFGIPINGGIVPDKPSYASCVGNQNAGATTIGAANTYVPIFAPPTPINSLNFDVQVLTVAGVSTPCLTYTGLDAETIAIDWNLFVTGVAPSSQDYIFQLCILKADLTTVVPTGCIGETVSQSTTYFISTVVPLSTVVQLDPGDSVFVRVQNIISATNVIVKFFNAKASNIAALISGMGSGAVQFVNGIGPDGSGNVALTTDDIPEGITNLYFTQARARQSLVAGNGINYDNTTGTISTPVPPQKTLFVSLGGVNDTNPERGEYNTPYAGIAYAISQITPAIGVMYRVQVVGLGSYSDTNCVIKPNVILDLGKASYTVTNPMILDSSWLTINGFSGIYNGINCNFSINADFNTPSYFGGTLEFNNIQPGANLWQITGPQSGFLTVNVNNVQAGVLTAFDFYLSDCDFNITDLQCDKFKCDINSSGYTSYIRGLLAYTDIAVTTHNSSNFRLSMDSFISQGTAEFKQSDFSSFYLKTTNYSVFSTLTVNCISAVTFTWAFDGWNQIPTFPITTPTLTYLSLANGINANYPSPANYTPLDPTVNGHLQGISAALLRTSANTPSTIVTRDGSGNFSAGTITAALSGNASTATSAITAANANNTATNPVSANVDYFIGFYLSQSSGYQGMLISSTLVGTPLTYNPFSSKLTCATLKLSALTASQAVVTDSGSNLISMAYTSVNTASTLVQRDSSGNFSAGTITAALNGNASTATSATNATNATNAANVGTLLTTTNSTFFVPFVTSNSTINQPIEIGSLLTFNPATGLLTSTSLTLAAAGNLNLGNNVTNVLTINSATGANNRADIILNRFDLTNGFSRMLFGTGGSNQWSHGLRSGSGFYTIFDEVNGVAQVTVNPGAGNTGFVTIAGSLLVNEVGIASFQLANGGAIAAKNTGGTLETWCYPRFTDNKTYMDIGSAGAAFRQDAAGTTWLGVDTSGNASFSQGNVLITTVGKTVSIKSGANGSTGTASFSSGTATVSTTAAATNDMVDIMVTTSSNQGLYKVAVTAGTGYTITSTNGSDASSFQWMRRAVG